MGIVAARSAGVLERETELAGLACAVVQARAGQGRLVVIEGPAGIGKSALIAAAGTLADPPGTRLLRARGGELEHDFAFGVVRQLLEPVLADAAPGARDELFQGPAGVAARLLGLPGASTEAVTAAPDASFAVLHGLYWLCANLAGWSPLVVTIDDLHWADAPSLRFLVFLLARLEELPLALVVAARPEAEAGTAALLGAVRGDRLARVLRPAALSQAAVGRVVEEGLERTPAAAFVEACRRATGGLPFLVRELVGALREDGVEPTAAAAERVEALGGRSVGRVIGLRLSRLPGPAAELARAVAVLETAELGQAADLAGLDPSVAADAADRLSAVGILRPGRPLAFVHPIVRAGTLEHVPGNVRARAHRRAAGLLAARDGGAERVAEHLLVTEPADDQWTVRRLSQAARTAARAGAPESAASYLRRALVEPPAPEARAEVLLELGVAEVTAGQPAGEDHLREALDAAGTDSVRLGAGLVLAHVLGRAERIAAAVQVIDRTAALLTGADSATRRLLEAMATGAGMLDVATAPGLAARLHAVRRAADEPAAPREVLGVATLVALHANEPAVTCAALAQRALAGGARVVPEPTDLPWFAQATIGLVWADAHEAAQVALDAGVAESRRTGDTALFASSHSQRAWLALRRGDLLGAEADARCVLDAEELATAPIYRRLAAAILVNALVERAEPAQAQAVFERFGDGDVGHTHTGAVLRLARGRLRLAQGRADAALADAQAAGDIALATGSTCPGFLAWRSAAALAYLALGDPDAALSAAHEEASLARAFASPRPLGAALRVAGVVAGAPAGEELLRESVACLERAGVALERARALAELGALLRVAGRPREARALLREALDVAHHAGATRLADRAASELRATGARPRRAALTGVEALTASERRVAELAAEGLTNREVAQALYLSENTIQTHLKSVFRKLGIRSRSQLTRAL